MMCMMCRCDGHMMIRVLDCCSSIILRPSVAGGTKSSSRSSPSLEDTAVMESLDRVMEGMCSVVCQCDEPVCSSVCVCVCMSVSCVSECECVSVCV